MDQSPVVPPPGGAPTAPSATLAAVSGELATVSTLELSDRAAVFERIHSKLTDVLAASVPGMDAATTTDGIR